MAIARWAPYRLFPYEKRLGERELVALAEGVGGSTDQGVEFRGDHAGVVARSTYFHEIDLGDDDIPTDQGLVEFVNLASRGAMAKRQATRYGLHGLHEYKGKFNPQLVRSMCNVVDPDAEVFADPFCGSGTSLLEALRLGMEAVGMDISPIAVFLSDTKLRATLYTDRRRLRREFLALAEELSVCLKEAQQTSCVNRASSVLDPDSLEYLRSWFPSESLSVVLAFIDATSTIRDSARRRLCEACFSSILREVSYQRPEDLRVRRRSEDFEVPPVWILFREATDAIAERLEEMVNWPPIHGRGAVTLGSADQLHQIEGVGRGRRLIVTSPPYATALPYIDTDRFSLVVLRLVSAPRVRRLEQELIGSREWSQREANEWTARLRDNSDHLPGDVVALARMIDAANAESGAAGFRRRAVPGLLYRYFARMRDCFTSWSRFLRPGESAAVIVGENRTRADGDEISIPTPALLATVAEQAEFVAAEIMPLETWPRYGLHSRNGINQESAVILRRR